MKLTLQIKLLPDEYQAKSLLKTIKECNKACNEISEVAWQNKIFNQYKVHHLVYYQIKEKFKLSAQVVVRCISKVINAYKLGRKKQRQFKILGAVTYDPRILSYRKKFLSIWTIDGRLKIPFICHNPKRLSYVQGEAYLITRKGKFYLFQTIEIPEDKIKDVEKFIGVDFGITNLAVTSDGNSFSGEKVNRIRKKATKFKRKLQKRGTKNAKRKLKKYSGKERRFKKHMNHVISKRIIDIALKTQRGIALEDLKGFKPTARKAQQEMFGKWAFSELRRFIEYKARLKGIPVSTVNPKYTSQTCSVCGFVSKSNRKSQSLFSCAKCGNNINADLNAAKVIAAVGCPVNQPSSISVRIPVFNRSSSGTESSVR